jgi:hypothetical protein
MQSMALMGTIEQRGLVTTDGGTTDLVVEVYDETTGEPIVGATVVVEPGATAGSPLTTDASGRATLAGPAPRKTITAIAPGYGLFTIVDTPANFASLPLVPTALGSSVSTFAGVLNFERSTGETALVGSNVFLDRTVETIRTSTSLPQVVPPTLIRPGRASNVTALSGVFEPTATPAFQLHNSVMTGSDGLTPRPSLSGVEAGQTSAPNLTLVGPAGGLVNFDATFLRDLTVSDGLGTLSGPPTVRVLTTLPGMVGTSLVGAGFATEGSPGVYTINGSIAVSQLAVLAPLSPLTFVSTAVRDTDGGYARNRRLLANPLTGDITALADVPFPGVPLVADPGMPVSAPVTITFEDEIDPTLVPFGLATSELTIVDATGRTWRVVIQDTDGATGQDNVTLPDLTGLVGLATGPWQVFVEQVLAVDLSTSGEGDFLFEERFRRQLTFARSPLRSLIVQ